MKPEVQMSEAGRGPRPEVITGEVNFSLHDAAHARLALAKWQVFRKWVEGHLRDAAERHGVELPGEPVCGDCRGKPHGEGEPCPARDETYF